MKRSLRLIAWAALTLALLTLVACRWPWQVDPTATPAPASAAGSTGSDGYNDDGAEVVFIPGGTFLMGSPDSDPDADGDEMPQHPVTVGPYYIYKHEVTNEMYNACVAAGVCPRVIALPGRSTAQSTNPLFATHPVTGVSWNMARKYCEWAGVRLPSDAEWEFASRGTAVQLYPWGDEPPDCNRVNMRGCSGQTAPVGANPGSNSPFEVWDMAGNVWEWTHDWYSDMYYHFAFSMNPTGPDTYQDPDFPRKSVRGGSFLSRPINLRTAARLGVDPFNAYQDVGFRCAESVGFTLPVGYIGVGEGLTIDDEPEGDETPEWFYRIGHKSVNCPTTGNEILIELVFNATPGTTFALSVDDVPFTCVYDEGTGIQQCFGPAPADFNSPGAPLAAAIHLEYPPLGVVEDGLVNIPKPDDCANADPSGTFSATAGCPDGGFVDITFTYDPAEVTWQTVSLRGIGTPLPCSVSIPGTMTCTAPNISNAGFYELYMYGENDDGLGRKRWPNVPVAVGCEPDDDFPIGWETFCDEDRPNILFSNDPAPHGLVSAVYDGATLVPSFNDFPGQAIARFADEDPGRETTMRVCYTSGACFDIPNVTVPTCSGDTLTGGEHDFTIEPVCYAPEGETVFEPAASIHFYPADMNLVSATAGGADLTCYKMAEGWYVCSVIPGSPGDTVTVTFCLEDATCYSADIPVDTCPGSTLAGRNQPSSGAWTKVNADCHTGPWENIVFFTVDTGYPWLDAAAVVSYSATDGIRTFSCGTHPSIVGRIYCSGLIPTEPGDLTLCIHRDGYADDCQVFEQWHLWYTGLHCAAVYPPTDTPSPEPDVPDDEPEPVIPTDTPKPEPTDEPPPEPTPDPCAGLEWEPCTYEYSNICEWVYLPDGGYCQSKP